jgi:hypothetical protein
MKRVQRGIWRGTMLFCPICFGASDAPMALGMNWGVLTLLAVTLGVLASFAVFFVRLVRRSEQAQGVRVEGGQPS